MKYLLLLSGLFLSHALLSQSPAYKDSVFTEYFRRTSGWTASDATISVPLPGGKSIWLFGDTHIDGYDEADNSLPCLFQVRNSMMVQSINQPSEFVTILDNTQTGINRTPVKLKLNDTTYFWPGHGYAKGDTAIIFWQQYSGANFTHMANYVSRIYTPGFEDASAIKALELLPLPAGVEYGTTVVVDSADNYLYLYGFVKDWIINRPLVARCSMDEDILEPWEFFDGSGWSPDVHSARQILADSAHYVSPSYSVIRLQDKYYMISQDIGFLTCGLGRDIYSWESDTPYGPFTNRKKLYTIEDKYSGSYYITYNATAHPEFIKDNELLISYNVNGICPSECENDPFSSRRYADGYRPKFIRVPLSFIDPELDVPDPVFPDPDPGIPTDLVPEDTGGRGGIKVYPNPSEGEFTVDIGEKGIDPRSARILVRDVWGLPVFSGSFQGREKTIRLNTTGVFFIHVISLDNQDVSKIIIE